MPALSPPDMVVVICMSVFTAIAAVIDLRTRRIPNKLTLPVFIGGIVFQIGCILFANRPQFASAGAALFDMFAAFGVGFGVLFILWMIGGGGGGDAKLMGALSVWLGFQKTLYVLILSTVVVLVGTLLMMIFGVLRQGLERTKQQLSESRQARTPGTKSQRRMMTYAFPVAVATWLVLIWFSFVKPRMADRPQTAQRISVQTPTATL